MDLNRGYRLDVDRRLNGVIWIIGLFFLMVFLRLFYLQVIKGDYYRVFSENNSIREISIPAERGIIFDRDGEMLAGNRPVFDVVVIPQYVQDVDLLSSELVGIFGPDGGGLLENIAAAMKAPPYRPYTIASDVEFDIVSKVKATKLPFKGSAGLVGVDIIHRYHRDYLEGDLAPHLLGYLREIDKKGLEREEKLHPGRYKGGDHVGVGGIEEQYDTVVRGHEGTQQKIVNAVGREVDYPGISFELIDEPVRAGENLYLTIDADLQRVSRRMFGEKRGALVALNPENGAILAVYSSPGYDLGRLMSSDRNNYWPELLGDDGMPLFNRAIQGMYPPASTYKIVTAVAALEEGVIDQKEKVKCLGGLRYGNRTFGCWKRSGHGFENMVGALAHSCDVFFYTVGLRLGIDSIARYAKLFGLGEKTGIDLPGEKGGLIPTKEWKRKMRNADWNEGETLSASIGQGYNLATPLQVALMGAVVANGGYRVRPYLVDKVVSNDGKELYSSFGRRSRIELSDVTLDVVKNGLREVVEGDNGTAGLLKGLGLKIAGKTGTAQIVSKEKKSGFKKKTHAWFVGYAPFDNPKIAVAVIVEHGGHGSSDAAPIAGEIIKEYLH